MIKKIIKTLQAVVIITCLVSIITLNIEKTVLSLAKVIYTVISMFNQ